MTDQQRDNVTHWHCIKIRISIIIFVITTLPKLMLLGDFSLITCHRSYPLAIESDYFCYEMLWHLKEKIEPENRFCLWPFFPYEAQNCGLAEIEFLSFILPHVKVLILTSLKAPEFDLLKTEPRVHLGTMILSTKIQKQKWPFTVQGGFKSTWGCDSWDTRVYQTTSKVFLVSLSVLSTNTQYSASKISTQYSALSKVANHQEPGEGFRI